MSATGILLTGWLVTSGVVGLLIAGMIRTAERSDSGSDDLAPWTVRGPCGDPEGHRAGRVHREFDTDQATVAGL
ncbi:hypothetical protein FHU33_4557 [Blastococcus colisei]|uniref:Uncharacterized protein n=1 Tax=Blastococcus colisei TaxID=1564162 RepID=A0A543P188_9ACTN|nr:hypothetical protein FHU33_4557 [Blastococcus colisei]